MFAKLFRTARPTETRVNPVRVLDGQFVIVVSEVEGVATIRYENDRTNSTYTVLTAWLK